jgi:hypothetical protein
MSAMNLLSRGQWARFMVLMCTLFVLEPFFVLAQDLSSDITEQEIANSIEGAQIVSDQLTTYEERYIKLFDQCIESLHRIATTTARQTEFTVLSEVTTYLDRAKVDFMTLESVMVMASLVTRKQFRPHAVNTVQIQRTTLVKRNRGYLRYIGQSLHLSKDEEITRLLVEARELFRSAGDFLESLQLTEPTTK